MGASAFESCSRLTTINLPECTSVGASAFTSCGFKTVTLPKCTSVGASAFYFCYNLKTISLPNCTSINSTAFNYCDALEEIHFAAANQATIEALSGYSSKFGASSATIYFDL